MANCVTRSAIILSAIALLLTGCFMISPPQVGSPWPQEAGGLIGDVRILLWVGYHSVNIGQPVLVRLTARNEGNKTAVFHSKSKPVLDITVGAHRGYDNTHLPLVRWSDGKPLTPDLTQLELKPGESKTILMTWTPNQEYLSSLASISGDLSYDAETYWYHHVPGVIVTVGWTPGPLP